MACHQIGPQQASKAGWEVADIFRQFGPEYRESRLLSSAQRKVMRAIEACRTAILGGHKEVCKHCGAKRHAYNSCRNRHCPKCQALVKAQWLEDRKAELLPVPYFHGVFTLPHQLNALVLANRATLLNMLFAVASATLLEFGRNNLGGKIGFTMLLHTWDQLLRAHFHVHCVIPAGALSADAQRWISGNPKFLFPVKALSRVFRGKFIDALEQAYAQGDLCVVGPAAELATPGDFANLIQGLRTADWVVYSKRPFGGPEKVLDYLGRYTHRVAISNHRILDVNDREVAITFRDRRQDDELRTATVSADEFIRRFLLHVLPDGFVRIRHFGFLASRTKARDLPCCRELLGQPPEPPPRRRLTVAEWVKELLDIDVNRCPSCGRGPIVRTPLPPRTQTVKRRPSQPKPVAMDTS